MRIGEEGVLLPRLRRMGLLGRVLQGPQPPGAPSQVSTPPPNDDKFQAMIVRRFIRLQERRMFWSLVRQLFR